MTTTYGTNVIPNDVVNVLAGSTVDISLAFNATVGYVGNMDTANGSATPGDVYHVPDSTTAASLFGEDSELHRHTQLAYQNGVADVYAVGVKETSTTDSFSSSSGTLGNAPAADPIVEPEHTISAQDTTDATSVTVNIVYGTPSAPSDANTMNLNPITGEWAADSSSSYDITYDYGDYAGGFTSVTSKNVRYVCALNESDSVANDLLTELNNDSTNFNLMRGMAGGQPDVSTISNYSDNLDDQRLSVTMAARGYIDDAETKEVRVCGPVAAKAAGKDLGDTMTNEAVAGLTGLRTEYTPQQASDLISNHQVMPVIPDDGLEVVKDTTTSTINKFSRIYACDIVDEVTELSHQISKQYIGELNFGGADGEEGPVQDLEDDHVAALDEMASDRPPLLYSVDGGQPYTVNADVDSSNSNKVNLEVGIDVVDVIDQIEVDIVVGDVVTNGGAS